MKIVRNGVEYELTSDELFMAYEEQKRLFIKENITNILEDHFDAFLAGCLSDNEEYLNIAVEMVICKQRKSDSVDYIYEEALQESLKRYIQLHHIPESIDVAKKDYPYKFSTEWMDIYLPLIRKGHLENTGYCFGAAVLEIGNIDVELNILAEGDVLDDADPDIDIPVIDYFCCYKTESGEWISDSYIELPVEVNWNSDNWREQLEKDMFNKLRLYAIKKGYNYLEVQNED